MNKIDEILTRRVEKILPTKEGLKKLMQSKKLRLYQGFDPTGGRLHLGHSVGIRKLMDFAREGHEVVFLFGTGTVLVGDPSQRDTGRKLIDQNEIDENIKGWKEQVSPLVEWDKVKILQNGDWLTKLTLKDIVNIASNISAIQLFKREMFQRRLDKGDTIWYHETMYPLLQGYDSVAMDVDLEIGGTDQEFNMLIGRELLRKMKSKEKFVLTTPMIVGTDGRQMSKSSGNCVWLNDTPNDMYTKLMELHDEHIITYMTLVTKMSTDRIEEVDQKLKEGTLHPVDAKKELATSIVTELHDATKAQAAQDFFEKTFQEKKPEFTEEISLKENLLETIAQRFSSKSEAKRLIEQHAVTINGSVISDPKVTLTSGDQIQIGKKIFIKTI